jgi:hypothetical protein
MPLIPTPTYITDCSKIKSDPYWKWIMSNPESWKESDRNHVIYHLNGFKPEYSVVQLQGMSKTLLQGLLADCVCLNSPTSVNDCTCTIAVNLYARAIDKFDKDTLLYTQLWTAHNSDIEKWNYFKGRLKTELEAYDIIGETVVYNPCVTADRREKIEKKNGFNYVCGYSDSAVARLLEEKMLQYPKPSPPTMVKPTRPELPPIQCCSQNFANINASKITMRDISQECKLTVTNTDGKTEQRGEKVDNTNKAKAAANPNALTDDDDGGDEPDYTLYIILAILVCISCCCSSSILLGGGGYFAFN